MVYFSNAEPKTKRSPSMTPIDLSLGVQSSNDLPFMTPIDLSLYYPTSNDSHLFADWVKALSLTIEDKRILMEGDWLSANHISAAQHLLRKAFPSQHGLQGTHYLAEKNKWLSSPTKFVQVLFIPPGHWACLSNKFCASDEVDLFDSLHTLHIADGSIAKQASRILQSNSPSMVINVINVQRQDNYSDCGLFALAMAYDLCSNLTLPKVVMYRQECESTCVIAMKMKTSLHFHMLPNPHDQRECYTKSEWIYIVFSTTRIQAYGVL